MNSEQGQGFQGLIAIVPQRRRNVGGPGLPQQSQHYVSQRCHHLRRSPAPYLGSILLHGHVPHVMQPVLNPPMSSPQAQQPLDPNLTGTQAGDGVCRLLSGYSLTGHCSFHAANLLHQGSVQILIHYPGLKQRCRPHLLRDIHKLKVLYPEDQGLAKWARGVQRLYTKGVSWAVAGDCSSRGQLALEKRLLKLCRPFLEDPSAVQGKLCRRIERHIKELFVFVSHPETPPDNNAAERSLRHLVISRKISGGTRSGAGSGSKMTLASLFGTWRAKDLNPFLECRRLLISPQV